MKYKNHYTREKIESNIGSRVKTKYRAEVDKKGVIDLVECGTEDLYGFIQSHADSVNIRRLVERYSGGEVDILSRFQGVFGDFTNVPTSYAELLNRVIAGENEFSKLPVEVKSKFNHSFAEFLTAAGTEDWYKKLGMEMPRVEPVPSDQTESVKKETKEGE